MLSPFMIPMKGYHEGVLHAPEQHGDHEGAQHAPVRGEGEGDHGGANTYNHCHCMWGGLHITPVVNMMVQATF